MKRTALVGLLALVTWTAQAASNVPGWRIGVAASFSDFRGDDVPDDTLDSKFIEDNTVGFKMYGGYQFNKWFGLEAAYHSLSDFEDNSTDEAFPGKLKLSFDGFSAQGLLFFRLLSEEVQGFVKAGYYNFDDQLSLSNNTTSNSSESGFVGGAGAILDLTENFSVRTEYERYDAEVGDLWSVNFGVQYSFGSPKEAAPAAAMAPPPPPPAPAESVAPAAAVPAADSMQADSDGDGVMDDGDECADTPSGTAVNGKGCAE